MEATTNTRKMFIRDKETGGILFPVSDAHLIQYNQNDTVENALNNISSNLENVTIKVGSGIVGLNSDTLVNISSDENGVKHVPENSVLSYIQIKDGKIFKADYTQLSAEQITYSLDNGKRISVADRFNTLGSIIEGTGGIDKIVASEDSPIYITRVYDKDNDKKLNHVELNVIADNETIVLNDFLTHTNSVGGKQLSIGHFSYTHVDNLVTYLHNIEDSVTTMGALTERSIYENLYELTKDDLIPDYNLKTLHDEISNNKNEFENILGKDEDNKPYFTIAHTVKNALDILTTELNSQIINTNTKNSGLTIENAGQADDIKYGRKIYANVDNETTFIDDDNNLVVPINIRFQSDNEKGIHNIQLYTVNPTNDTETIINTLDATDFVKDSFLSKAELKNNENDATKPPFSVLRLTWKTVDDSGKNIQNTIMPVDIDLTQYIKPYFADGNGLVLDGQTFKININRGLSVEEVTKDNVTSKFIGIKLDKSLPETNDNEKFLSITDEGVKLNNISKTINDTFNKINAEEINVLHNENDYNVIDTVAKPIVGISSYTDASGVHQFSVNRVDLTTNEIKHSWSEKDKDEKTILHDVSLSSYINVVNDKISNLNSAKTSATDVNTLIDNKIKDLDSDLTNNNNGQIITGVHITDGKLNSFDYDNVDNFTLQKPINKDVETQTLGNALSYLISVNDTQNIDLNNIHDKINELTDNTNSGIYYNIIGEQTITIHQKLFQDT